MTMPRGRRRALVWLGAAYARHLLRRRVRPKPAVSADVVRALYQPDHLVPLTLPERNLLPPASRCINCGLCALAAGRVAGSRPADLPVYLRDLSLLPAIPNEVETLARSGTPGGEALAAAGEACPTGVPLGELAATIYRLSRP
jgi:hypothetical protein